MKLGFEEEQSPYISPSQSARAWTEHWVRREVYCPNCGNSGVSKFANNQPVADFFCASCNEEYELKSQKDKFGAKVLDGAFGAMCSRLAASNNPNLMLLNYDRKKLKVTDLFVVPKHFFVREIIEERKTLGARQLGARDGSVAIFCLIKSLHQEKSFSCKMALYSRRSCVLSQWHRTLFLRDEGIEARGWLIEVMKCVEDIGKREFQLEDVYAFEAALSKLYPENRHVRQKIWQQLQVLRDRGYLDFVARGNYRLRSQD